MTRAQEASIKQRLFVYGTLLCAELRYAVLRRPTEACAAQLRDYVCYRVKRAAYPGIVAMDGALTDGAIVDTLDAHDWAKLDDYESTMYQRERVIVTTSDARTLECHTYVVAPAYRYRLTGENWDYDTFKTRHLGRYLGALNA